LVWLVWLKFAFCVLVIFFSGRAVAKYGDIIAIRTGLGRIWIGVVLLALVTSLPELFTGISAVTLVNAPDLTIGNLFGANAFNLFNLALLDIAYRYGSLFSMASPVQRLTGWFSMVLAAIAGVSIFISSRFFDLGLGWIGWYTPVIIILYLFFMWRIFRSQQRQPARPLIEQPDYEGATMSRVYLYFITASVLIIGAGTWLAVIGEEIATVTGLGESFIGSLLIGFSTTLPEITVSFAALRLGAVDMAVANMIGSNLFNMAIIPIDDLLYTQGPVLNAVSTSHLLTAGFVIVMTGVFIAGLHFKPRRFSRLSWCSLTLIVLFLIQAYLSYTMAS
jgi:cation:H+ antiporter